MGLNKFKASNGWLEKFKQRHELKFRTLSGESASADNYLNCLIDFLCFQDDQDLFIESLSKLNLRQVVTIISDAWNNVSADIIYNCWQKVFRQSPSDSSCINESSEEIFNNVIDEIEDNDPNIYENISCEPSISQI
ncbi:uncharacterized protein LOC115229058 [Octopus sinensis]|uniref:Uncharacterized protein LOC115229058 n=1 Tax=Octopus sinensis TaxID=2607531 RepID=A0A6P7U1D6_9MOLL|nr:uncharacterized protein LOC115229058 [Octopus sinensis]